MGYTAAAIIGSALIGGGASIYGSNSAARAGKPNSDVRFPSTRPAADPLQAALESDALSALGIPGYGAMLRASPLEQAVAELYENPSLTLRQKRRGEQGLRRYMVTGSISPELRRTRAVTGLGGFRNLEDLRRADLAFRQRESAFRESSQAALDKIREDRLSAAQLLAQSGSAKQLDQTLQDVRDVRDRRLVEQANRYGFSPVASLTAPEERVGALQEALALLSGRQELASRSLAGSPNAALAAQLIQGGRQATVGGAGPNLQGSGAEGAGIAGAGGYLATAIAQIAQNAHNKRMLDQLSSKQVQSGLGAASTGISPTDFFNDPQILSSMFGGI